MKKALLFGATGLLGQALFDTLSKRGWQIEAPGRKDGDLRDEAFLKEALIKSQADCVFNATGWTAVDDAEDHHGEAWGMNVTVPGAMARIISALPKGNFIHFSTDFIFGGKNLQALDEDSQPQPESVYGKTKLEGEKAVLGALPGRSCIIRTAWLFGPRRKNFVDTILAAARKNPVLKVVNDQRGSPTYVKDLADWSEKLAAKKANGVFHGINSGQASWHELASEAVRLAGVDCAVMPINSAQWPQKAKRPEYSVLDNSKLSLFLGEAPRHWKEALKEYLASQAQGV